MRLIPILLSCAVLSACTTTKYVGVPVYPELPPIEAPADPQLQSYSFVYPKDAKGNPVVGGNVFVGLAQSDLDIILANQEKLKARDQEWQTRITQVNSERASWHQTNLENQKKLSNKQ